MTALVTFLVFCQTFGASAGALISIWSEFAYIRAMRDGQLDSAEKAHLKIIASGLRFGMTIMILASFGLVVTSYVSHDAVQPALTQAYWTLLVLALIIIGISWALSRHRVQFAFGSAVIFTSWWFLAYLTLGWLSPISFGSAVALLVVATAVIYALLHYIRMLAGHLAQKEN